jgi:hypothetical protein
MARASLYAYKFIFTIQYIFNGRQRFFVTNRPKQRLFGQISLYVYEILSMYKNLYGNIFQNVLYYRRNLEKSPCGSRE